MGEDPTGRPVTSVTLPSGRRVLTTTPEAYHECPAVERLARITRIAAEYPEAAIEALLAGGSG